MNNAFNKIDWSSFGYASVYLGFPVLLFGLSLESISDTTQWLMWLPLSLGVLTLLFTDRQELLKIIYPFSAKSGKGTARYLGIVGLISYTSGRILPPELAKTALLFNTGLVLVAASALWYMIRLWRFKEKGL